MEVIVRRIKSDELYHHGTDGQKWGVQHGPPYPLDPSPARQATRKKNSKSLYTIFKNKRKGRKLRKAKEAKKKEQEENRKAIESGDVNQVLKRKDKMSNEELNAAIERLNLTEKIKNLNSESMQRKMKSGKSFLETAATTLGTIATAADSAAKVRGALEKLGVVKKREDPKSLKDAWAEKASISDNKKKFYENTAAIEKLIKKNKKDIDWEKKNKDLENERKAKENEWYLNQYNNNRFTNLENKFKDGKGPDDEKKKDNK